MAKQTGPVGANASQGARQNVRRGSSTALTASEIQLPVFPDKRISSEPVSMSQTGP